MPPPRVDPASSIRLWAASYPWMGEWELLNEAYAHYLRSPGHVECSKPLFRRWLKWYAPGVEVMTARAGEGYYKPLRWYVRKH